MDKIFRKFQEKFECIFFYFLLFYSSSVGIFVLEDGYNIADVFGLL